MAETLPFAFFFVDESGDLGQHGSKFFTIACLATRDAKQIERIIKKVRERKLKKKKRDIPELKANSSSPEVRKAVLYRLSRSDCEISLIIIDKKQIRDYLYNAKNKLYNYFFGLLVKELDLNKTKIEIVIDKKDSNRLPRADLEQYLAKKIKEQILHPKIRITHPESHAHKALQATDFIAWAANRKYSFGDDSYYKVIEPKIKTVKKLWEK